MFSDLGSSMTILLLSAFIIFATAISFILSICLFIFGKGELPRYIRKKVQLLKKAKGNYTVKRGENLKKLHLQVSLKK
jgi:Sec-independent protein translocase protein TatA